jgi:hypothetical protein
MPHPRPLPSDPDEHERQLVRLEDDQDEATDLQERLNRAAERASLPFWHPAIHRLARLERARRTGLPDDREAA